MLLEKKREEELHRLAEQAAELAVQGGTSLGMLPIHQACAVGNLDEVKSLVINEQCNVNVRDDKNHTPLIIAAHMGKTDVVKYLTSLNNCDISLKDSHGRMPIHHAAQGGHGDVITILLQDGKGSSMIEDNEGTVPLQIASFNGFLDVVQLLAGQKISIQIMLITMEEHPFTALLKRATSCPQVPC